MKFGDKVREQRENAGLTKEKLAKAIGTTARTIANYESGVSYPQDRGVYDKLANLFDVDVNYFYTENEEFLLLAAKNYGKKGLEQANAILEQTAALFAGGELSEIDQIAFLHTMQSLFLESKQIARDKFTPKKYRKNEPNRSSGKPSDI